MGEVMAGAMAGAIGGRDGHSTPLQYLSKTKCLRNWSAREFGLGCNR